MERKGFYHKEVFEEYHKLVSEYISELNNVQTKSNSQTIKMIRTLSKEKKKLVLDFLEQRYSETKFSEARRYRLIQEIVMILAEFLKGDIDDYQTKEKSREFEKYLLNKVSINTKRKLSKNTRAEICTIYKVFWKWKLDSKRTLPKFLEDLEIRREEPNPNPNLYLTENEVIQLTRVCSGNNLLTAMIWFLWESGVRIGELITLKISNVNMDIDADYYSVFIPVVKKNTKSRVLEMKISKPSLKVWLATHPNKDNPNAPLFCSMKGNTKGKPLKYYNIRNTFNRYGERADLKKDITPHWFRKSCAYNYANAGWTERELMDWFGWKRSATASYYIAQTGRTGSNAKRRMHGDLIEEHKQKELKVCPKCYSVYSLNEEYCPFCRVSLGEEKEFLIDRLRKTEEAIEILQKERFKSHTIQSKECADDTPKSLFSVRTNKKKKKG